MYDCTFIMLKWILFTHLSLMKQQIIRDNRQRISLISRWLRTISWWLWTIYRGSHQGVLYTVLNLGSRPRQYYDLNIGYIVFLVTSYVHLFGLTSTILTWFQLITLLNTLASGTSSYLIFLNTSVRCKTYPNNIIFYIGSYFFAFIVMYHGTMIA